MAAVDLNSGCNSLLPQHKDIMSGNASLIASSLLSSPVEYPSSTASMSPRRDVTTTPLSSLDGCEVHAYAFSWEYTSPVGPLNSDASNNTNRSLVIQSDHVRLSSKKTRRPEVILPPLCTSGISAPRNADNTVQLRPLAQAIELALDRGSRDPPQAIVRTSTTYSSTSEANTNISGKISTSTLEQLSNPSSPADDIWTSTSIRQTNTTTGPSLQSPARSKPLPTSPRRSSRQTTIFRTASIHEKTPLCQPAPEANICLRGCAGNKIAQLEASAERLSRSNSIDEAIRKEHQELKRSDSRRSAILATNIQYSIPRIASHSKQNSIIELNAARRYIGFSEQAMSPTTSTSASNIEKDSPVITVNDDFPFVSRHGSGGVSVHNNHSERRALPEIVGMGPQITLAQEALDEAGYGDGNNPAIRVHSHQQINSDPNQGAQCGNEYSREEQERRKSTGSGGTYEQAQIAFGDFDGVHCDPDTTSDYSLAEGLPKNGSLPILVPGQPQQHPISYADAESSQQMLYYPARVPAMLQLPPKLAKNKAPEKNSKQLQVPGMKVQADAPKKEQGQSRLWLPDPIASEAGSFSLNLGILADNNSPAAESSTAAASAPVDSATPGSGKLRLPPRLGGPDKRKTRLSGLGNLPPQLRASVFFDLAPPAPEVTVKNGSAMDTLDSMLDAAATAPVNAFTDHTFANQLDMEGHGHEKKSSNQTSVVGNTQPSSQQDGHTRSKTKGPFASLVEHIKTGESGHWDDDAQPVTAAVNRRDLLEDTENGRQSGSEYGPAAEDDPDNEKEKIEEEIYQGVPTTLLAELQLRKQQQKMRTRPTYTSANGMHSTLLELDTVAEVERKARKGKKVNLAWEDPLANPEDDDDDDEDIPLGVLYASKAAGNNDVSATTAELNRPLGLMAKRELEDNEPLSRRRDRLQSGAGIGMYLSVNNALMKRQSMLSLRQSAVGKNQSQEPPSVEERENEPLAARLRRIKAKEESELPYARPVSSSFSQELLSQFGDLDGEGKGKEKAKEAKSSKAQPREEEETLGQRRCRLQAGKEGHGQEMLRPDTVSGGPSFNSQALEALTGGNQLTHRLSLGNMPGAQPHENAYRKQDPHVVGRQEQTVGNVRRTLAVPMQVPPRGQTDLVERWRQSVFP